MRNPDGQSGTLGNGFEYLVVPVLDPSPAVPTPLMPTETSRWTAGSRRLHRFLSRTTSGTAGKRRTGRPCDQDTPTPVFEYLKTGKLGSPNAVFTVTLRIEDTMGNSNTATTTVSVRQAYE